MTKKINPWQKDFIPITEDMGVQQYSLATLLNSWLKENKHEHKLRIEKEYFRCKCGLRYRLNEDEDGVEVMGNDF